MQYIEYFSKVLPYISMHYVNVKPNVLFTLNRTTHSSKTLLRLVRINVNKTLGKSLKCASNRDMLILATLRYMY